MEAWEEGGRKAGRKQVGSIFRSFNNVSITLINWEEAGRKQGQSKCEAGTRGRGRGGEEAGKRKGRDTKRRTQYVRPRINVCVKLCDLHFRVSLGPKNVPAVNIFCPKRTLLDLERTRKPR